MGWFVVMGLCLLLLQGCASVSRSTCESGDWQKLGFRDAVDGYSAERIAAHTYACGKHQITPDKAAYQAGFNQGLVQYCVPNNGYRLGVNGQDYHYECPASLEISFLTSYIRGLDQQRGWVGLRYRELDNELLFGRRSSLPVSVVPEHQKAECSTWGITSRRGELRDRLGDLRFRRMTLDHMINRAETRLKALERTPLQPENG